MAKLKDSLFICKSCGNEFTKWQGQCAYCGEWNTLKEVSGSALGGSVVSSRKSGSKNASLRSRSRQSAQPLQLSQIQSQTFTRFSTGFDELDRVFGQSSDGGSQLSVSDRKLKPKTDNRQPTTGIVPGSVTLLSGEPGMGKSTLLSQLALKLSQGSGTISSGEGTSAPLRRGVLYICGEESSEQVKLRMERLALSFRPPMAIGEEKSFKITNQKQVKKISPPVVHQLADSLSQNNNLFLLSEINLETIIDLLLKHPDDYQLVIIDSIQSLSSDQIPSFAGSISQVRECGFQLTQVLKQTHTAGIFVGHVTKDGTLAGPKTLEHMVDTVLRLEGERTHDLRLVRSVKNRFGTTDEVGVFRMSGRGLEEVSNPGDVFLENSQQGEPGSVIISVLEGNRVMLLEIQALVIKSNLAIPRRVANGVSLRRLQMILAVLQKQLHLHLEEMDVFVNVAGGVNIREPAADLAMALAVVSSLKNKPVGNSHSAASFRPSEAEGREEEKSKTQPSHLKISSPGQQRQARGRNGNTPVVFGELGLLGEIRPVVGTDKRLQTARKLGYTRFIGVEERHIKEIKI